MHVPPQLRERPQWVAWKREELDNGKIDKLPIDPKTGRMASHSDPSTWATFQEALDRAEHDGLAGVGYVLTAGDPFTCIDLDDCRKLKTGAVDEWAREVLDRFGETYTELSPSGTGLHIWVKGKLPGKGKHPEGLGVFDRLRFIVMTGQPIEGHDGEILDRQDVLTRWYLETFSTTESREEEPGDPISPPLEDHEVMELLRGARNWEDKVRKLWDGQWKRAGYSSPSEADAGLIAALAFYTQDRRQLDRLFRQSRLCRIKWLQRPDYRKRTIDLVLSKLRDAWRGRGGEYNRTEAGNAELFRDLYGINVRYDTNAGRWLLWNGQRWEEDADKGVMRLALKVARFRYTQAETISDQRQREQEAKWALRSDSHASLKATLAIASSLEGIADSGEWDTDPLLLGVVNGVIELRTGHLRDGRREDRMTKFAPVVYHPNATYPVWSRVVPEIFSHRKDVLHWIHKSVGYSITGLTREQALFFATGIGRNGKDKFMETLRKALGEGPTGYAKDVPFSTFEAHNNDRIPNDIAMMAGRRFITASETQEGKPLNEGRLKYLTGSESITARFLRQEWFTFKPQMKLWFAVNKKPRVRDESHGFWRRMRLIPFEERFEGSRDDKQLSEKLEQELPGILAWAVEGCLLWQQEGLDPPPDLIVKATEDYRRDQDPLGDWLSERTESGTGEKFQASFQELFKDYREWATDLGISERDQVGYNVFGRRMGDLFEKVHTRHGKAYRGIRLL